MNRRQYIHRAVRGGLLATLVVGTGILVSRRQVSLSGECGSGKQCAACGELGHCALPSAAKEREREMNNG